MFEAVCMIRCPHTENKLSRLPDQFPGVPLPNKFQLQQEQVFREWFPIIFVHWKLINSYLTTHMERRNFIKKSGLATAGGAVVLSSCNREDERGMGPGKIQHGVIFTLQYEKGSPEAKQFMEDGRRILTGIPVVQNFQVFDQVSKKNDYQYGFTMVFDNMDDYQTYNEHPDHVGFVEDRWKKEVTDFLEIDFEVY